MGKSPHFQQEKPSQLRAQGQTRTQNQVHSAIQPKMAAPPQGAKPVAPPVYWPQPAPQALQRKAAGEGPRNGAQAPPAAPPVYYPRQAPKALQTKSASAQGAQAGQAPGRAAAPPVYGARPAVVQAKCTCGKPGNKHRSDCPANKNQLRAKAAKVKVVHQESQSFMNLYAYDSGWAAKRGITESMVKDFVKSYGGVIHGHASSRADKDAKRHANTTKDLEAFHSWYNQNY